MEAQFKDGMIVTTKLDSMYQEYLQKIGIEEASLPLDQKVEMKRAFFAGLGYMFHNMTEIPGIIEDDFKIIQTFKDYDDQISNFWEEQRNFQEEYRKFVEGDSIELERDDSDIVQLERGESK